MQKQTEAQTADTSGLTNIKSKLDLVWVKIQNALQQETEGRKLWIAGTLELIDILGDARNRLGSDQAFGTWLTDNGYGETRITRQDRSALLNMAEHPNVTREVLQQTHRRSWRLIWEEEIQPRSRLPSGGQPADGENPEANPANNSEQTAGEKKPTRRPRKGNGKKKPKEEWGKDLKD